MKDPTRWRDPSAGADPQVRALLLDDRAPLPSNAEVDRIWSGLAAGLNIAPGPTAAPQASQVAVAVAAGKGALGAKLTLAIVLVAGAGVGLHSLSSHNDREAEPSGKATQMKPSQVSPPADRMAVAPLPKPAAPPAAPAAQEIRPRPEKSARARSVALASQPAAPAVAIPAAEELPPSARVQADFARRHSPRELEETLPGLFPGREAAGRVAPAVPEIRPQVTAHFEEPPAPQIRAQATAHSEEPPVSVNELLEESRRLDRVRTALRAHHPDRALQLLKVGVPTSSPLAQEREALTIEAQAAKPSLRAAATERARAFMLAYPQSPYRARIRAIIFESE
jgi:hypothetical protein